MYVFVPVTYIRVVIIGYKIVLHSTLLTLDFMLLSLKLRSANKCVDLGKNYGILRSTIKFTVEVNGDNFAMLVQRDRNLVQI